DPSATALSGAYTFVRPIQPGASAIAARLAPGDSWPENDQLTMLRPRPASFERWWVGKAASLSGWKTMVASALPIDPTAFLRAGIEGIAWRGHYVTDAVVKLIGRLHPADHLSVGSFAQDLKWWTSGPSVRQTTGASLPPSDVFPHGPTNLEFALRELARMSDGT